MSDEEKDQQEIDREIEKWRNSKGNTPLVIEFDDGQRFVFIKAA